MSKNIIRTAAECQKILDDMNQAAAIAAADWMANHEDRDAAGFAFVSIPKNEYSLRRAAGSPFPRRLTWRGDTPSAIMMCGNFQSISAHEAVAKAAAASLKSNGVDAHYFSRMD